MNRFSTFGAMWCLTIFLCPALQVRKPDLSSAENEKLREVVSVLRAFWGQDFESNYRKYLLGSSPTVILIRRDQMIRIAAARLDGRRTDGAITQGLTVFGKTSVNIFVVYDDIAPLFVAKTIIHEIGHVHLRGEG